VNWSTRKVLVTGAGGFIGSHLTERLVELGAKVRAFVRYNSNSNWGWLDTSPRKNDIEVVLGDVRERDSVKAAMNSVDTVFHLAALIGIPYSYESPTSYIRTNVDGSVNVFQIARENGIQLVVHTSTSEVYGSALYTPIDEKHPLQAQSPYSASKIAADKLAEAYHFSFGLPVVTVRPFNTYGPRQSARAVIPTIISQALGSDTIRIGSSVPSRDFTFISDTVSGFIAAAESPSAIGHTINLGTGTDIRVGDLVRLILSITGKDIPVQTELWRVRPESSEVMQLRADNSAAKQLLNWQPRCLLDDGLRQTVEWIRNNAQFYRTGIYQI
jgi:NAD dependent epimerase/dehydratase